MLENAKVTCAADGTISVDGMRTPYRLEKGIVRDNEAFYLVPTEQRIVPQFAWHRRKRDQLDAIRVFLDGATLKDGESVWECIVRTLRLCMETGSRNVERLYPCA